MRKLSHRSFKRTSYLASLSKAIPWHASEELISSIWYKPSRLDTLMPSWSAMYRVWPMESAAMPAGMVNPVAITCLELPFRWARMTDPDCSVQYAIWSWPWNVTANGLFVCNARGNPFSGSSVSSGMWYSKFRPDPQARIKLFDSEKNKGILLLRMLSGTNSCIYY